MTRQAYVLPDNEVVVFWTPKAACTSIATMVYRYLAKSGQIQGKPDDLDMRKWLVQQGIWKNAAQAQKLCEDDGYKSLGLIRDPYDRLISAYINKFVRNKSRSHTELGSLAPFAREFYLNITKRADTEEFAGISFRDFVMVVCQVIEDRQQREPQLNHHWNTQIPFAYGQVKFEYDELFSLDSAALFFRRLEAVTDIKPPKFKLNATVYSTSDECNQPLQDETSLRLIERKNFAKEQFHDPYIAHAVRSAFSLDYEYIRKAL